MRGANAGQIYRSTNYGWTWTLITTIPYAITALANDGAGLVLLITENGHLFKSTDSGLSWSDKGVVSSNPSGVGGAVTYALTVMPSGTVLVGDTSTNGHVFRSTDSAETFTDVGAVAGAPIYRLQKVNGGVIAGCFLTGRVIKSIDDGLTWSLKASFGAVSNYAIECTSNGTALIGTDTGDIHRSTDNGDTWSLMTNVLDECDDFVALDDNTIVLSTYMGKKNNYLSRDGGLSWISMGPISTAASGDWVDHMIPITTPDGPIVLGGSRYGYVLRGSVSI